MNVDQTLALQDQVSKDLNLDFLQGRGRGESDQARNMVSGRSKESGRNFLLLCCLGVSWAFSPTPLIASRPLSLAMRVTTWGAHLSAPKPRTTPLLVAPGPSLRACSARHRFHPLFSQSSGGGGSLMSLEQKIIQAAAFLTNLFPLWVMSAACLGLARPAALAWLRSTSPQKMGIASLVPLFRVCFVPHSHSHYPCSSSATEPALLLQLRPYHRRPGDDDALHGHDPRGR